MAFVTYPLNNVLYQAEDAELYNSTRQSGLFAADDFSYEVSGADSNITIGEGIGWIKNGRFAGKVFANKTNEILDLGLPDATLPRLDVVAIRFDKATNATSLVIKNGTASSVPTIPTISRTESVYELYICSVRREPGAVVITNADITDLRLDESVCGLMRDAVTGIPTAELHAQFMAKLEMLDEALSEVMLGGIPPHAITHSKSGGDWVSPESIGAETAPIRALKVVVPSASFTTDTTYEAYGYRARIVVEGATEDMLPDVVFSLSDATSGIFAPIAAAHSGGVYIYANAVPETDAIIEALTLWKAV